MTDSRVPAQWRCATARRQAGLTAEKRRLRAAGREHPVIDAVVYPQGVSQREAFMIAATTSSGASTYFGGIWLIFEIAWLVLVVAGLWMTLTTAGKPGWGAIIPIYNIYLIIKVAGRPGWWLILYFHPRRQHHHLDHRQHRRRQELRTRRRLRHPALAVRADHVSDPGLRLG